MSKFQVGDVVKTLVPADCGNIPAGYTEEIASSYSDGKKMWYQLVGLASSIEFCDHELEFAHKAVNYSWDGGISCPEHKAGEVAVPGSLLEDDPDFDKRMAKKRDAILSRAFGF